MVSPTAVLSTLISGLQHLLQLALLAACIKLRDQLLQELTSDLFAQALEQYACRPKPYCSRMHASDSVHHVKVMPHPSEALQVVR